MKKIIPKELLDAAIDAERKYHRSEVTLANLIASEKALAEVTHSGNLTAYTTWSRLLSAIFGYEGLKKDATNEDIYAVLQALGWEVAE